MLEFSVCKHWHLKCVTACGTWSFLTFLTLVSFQMHLTYVHKPFLKLVAINVCNVSPLLNQLTRLLVKKTNSNKIISKKNSVNKIISKKKSKLCSYFVCSWDWKKKEVQWTILCERQKAPFGISQIHFGSFKGLYQCGYYYGECLYSQFSLKKWDSKQKLAFSLRLPLRHHNCTISHISIDPGIL